MKRFALKYIKVMSGLNAERRQRSAPLKLLEAERARKAHDADDSGEVQGAEGSEADSVEIPRLGDMEVEAKVEILAFMQAQGYKPADSRGASGRFVRPPGCRGQTAPTGSGGGFPRREVPPKGRGDLSCVNCGRKGHAASECRQPRGEKGERPCFQCGTPGHESCNCPDKGKIPIKALEDAPRRPPPVFCVTARPAPDADCYMPVAHGRRMQ